VTINALGGHVFHKIFHIRSLSFNHLTYSHLETLIPLVRWAPVFLFLPLSPLVSLSSYHISISTSVWSDILCLIWHPPCMCSMQGYQLPVDEWSIDHDIDDGLRVGWMILLPLPSFHVIVDDLLEWMVKAFDIGTEGRRNRISARPRVRVPAPGWTSIGDIGNGYFFF